MIGLSEYIKHKTLQLKVSIECLEEYDQNASWRLECGSVVDIGSGDGSFTSNYLTKYLPENCKNIVGYDISEEMVQYAIENYQNERVTFKACDISEPVSKENFNKFNQAFSFFALHWPKEQRKVFRNIFDLLAPGGGCFLVILGRVPSFFETYRILVNTTKWRSWLFNAEYAISPYYDSVDPVGEIEQMMADVGFVDIKVSYKVVTYAFKDIEDFQACVKAVNIFPIPEDQFKEYLNDFGKIAKEKGYVSDNYEIECGVFVALAKKN